MYTKELDKVTVRLYEGIRNTGYYDWIDEFDKVYEFLTLKLLDTEYQKHSNIFYRKLLSGRKND